MACSSGTDELVSDHDEEAVEEEAKAARQWLADRIAADNANGVEIVDQPVVVGPLGGSDGCFEDRYGQDSEGYDLDENGNRRPGQTWGDWMFEDKSSESGSEDEPSSASGDPTTGHPTNLTVAASTPQSHQNEKRRYEPTSLSSSLGIVLAHRSHNAGADKYSRSESDSHDDPCSSPGGPTTGYPTNTSLPS